MSYPPTTLTAVDRIVYSEAEMQKFLRSIIDEAFKKALYYGPKIYPSILEEETKYETIQYSSRNVINHNITHDCITFNAC